MGSIDNKWALVQVMSWCRIRDKPLSEPIFIQLIDAYIRHYGRWVNDTLFVLILVIIVLEKRYNIESSEVDTVSPGITHDNKCTQTN